MNDATPATATAASIAAATAPATQEQKSGVSSVMHTVIAELAPNVNTSAIAADVEKLIDTVVAAIPGNPAIFEGVEREMIHGLLTGFIAIVTKHMQ